MLNNFYGVSNLFVNLVPTSNKFADVNFCQKLFHVAHCLYMLHHAVHVRAHLSYVCGCVIAWVYIYYMVEHGGSNASCSMLTDGDAHGRGPRASFVRTDGDASTARDRDATDGGIETRDV